MSSGSLREVRPRLDAPSGTLTCCISPSVPVSLLVITDICAECFLGPGTLLPLSTWSRLMEAPGLRNEHPGSKRQADTATRKRNTSDRDTNEEGEKPGQDESGVPEGPGSSLQEVTMKWRPEGQGTAGESFPGRPNKLLRSPKQPGQSGEGEREGSQVGASGHKGPQPGGGACSHGTGSHVSRFLDNDSSCLEKVEFVELGGSGAHDEKTPMVLRRADGAMMRLVAAGTSSPRVSDVARRSCSKCFSAVSCPLLISCGTKAYSFCPLEQRNDNLVVISVMSHLPEL